MIKKLLISTFIALFIFISANADAALKKGPYIQSAGKTEVTIVWQTDHISDGKINWGLDENLGNEINAQAGEMHKIVISGLQADTTYFYQVTSDGATSSIYSFITAPEPWTPYRFIAFGDSRSGYADHRRVAEAILQEAPDIYFNSGDISCTGTDELCWQNHFDIEKDLMATTYMMPAIGNHDTDGANVANYQKFFAPPPNGKGDLEGRFYFQDWGNARFIVLDYTIGFPPGSVQSDWMLEVLQDAYDSKDILHTLIIVHEGPYTAKSGRSGNSNLRNMMGTFKDLGVTCIFSGHDHHYYRGESDNGVNFLVTGGGGAGLYDCDMTQDWGIRNVMCEKTYHYVMFDVNGPDISAVAITSNGEELERFTWRSTKTPPDYNNLPDGDEHQNIDGDNTVIPDGDTGNNDNGGLPVDGKEEEQYNPEFGFAGCSSSGSLSAVVILLFSTIFLVLYRTNRAKSIKNKLNQ